MSFSVFLSFLPYALVTAFTPGPNNVVALYSVGRSGWRRGARVILGMIAGFLCVMALCAAFCYELAVYVPGLAKYLKYVGAAYILWLAVHVLRSAPAQEEGRPMTFWSGFALQFVNVKIILFAITIYTGYLLPAGGGLGALLLAAAVLTAIGASGFITWAAVGGVLQKFLARHFKPFNYAMASILALCAVKLAVG